jgi:hypothetical protein
LPEDLDNLTLRSFFIDSLHLLVNPRNISGSASKFLYSRIPWLKRGDVPHSKESGYMSEYLADVRRYDAGADEAVVDKIVKHLGIALRNRDSSLVSATDPEEMKRVRTNWVAKKLGLNDEAKGDEVVAHVAEVMKGDRNKNRVTFYYLVAKQLGKLGDL